MNEGGAAAFYKEALRPENCDCPEECEEAVFQAQVSSAQWPALAYWPALAQRHNFTVNNETVTEDYVLGVIKSQGFTAANAMKDSVMVSEDFITAKDKLAERIDSQGESVHIKKSLNTLTFCSQLILAIFYHSQSGGIAITIFFVHEFMRYPNLRLIQHVLPLSIGRVHEGGGLLRQPERDDDPRGGQVQLREPPLQLRRRPLPLPRHLARGALRAARAGL